MKVLIIQGESMTPGLSTADLKARWAQFEQYGIAYRIISLPHPITTASLDAALADEDALIGVYITSGLLQESLFQHHPKLKYIATTSHGFEDFDIALTHRYGVTITNTIYGDVTIAQYAMALLLGICHRVQTHHHYLKDDYFAQKDAPFTKALTRQIELYDKTIGIIGLGAIGYQFAKMTQGFGAHVISYDQRPKQGAQYDFIKQVSLDELLSQSDIISLHCPLTAATTHLIDQHAIDKMKDGVILINTARGKLIDEAALLAGLNSQKIYAAGLDVLTDEAPQERSPLIDHPHCLVTGHIAWLSVEARLRSVDLAVSNYLHYLDGQPTSVINRE